ncbi:MAG TPA: TspO/MBR family protein [Patescibacteria group bacterium]|nr:TspO/MBR family protein [Patescibacteria group bacterium]
MDLGWYSSLNKPLFTPPVSAFGPVWTILYIFIAISGFLIWKKRKKIKSHSPFRYYFLQIILNLIWSPVFFGLHQIGLAFLIIVAMWILVYKNIVEFQKIDKTAAILLYPYLGWITIAGLLNLSVMLLN